MYIKRCPKLVCYHFWWIESVKNTLQRFLMIKMNTYKIAYNCVGSLSCTTTATSLHCSKRLYLTYDTCPMNYGIFYSHLLATSKPPVTFVRKASGVNCDTVLCALLSCYICLCNL